MSNIFDQTEDMMDENEEESKANWEAWNEHEQLVDTSFDLLFNFISAVYDQFNKSKTCLAVHTMEHNYVHLPEKFKEFLLSNENHIKDTFNTTVRAYRTNQQAMFHLMAEKKPSNN